MRARVRHIFMITVVMAVLAVGCGGGGSTTTVTKARFIKQATPICERQSRLQLATVAMAQKQGASKQKMMALALAPLQKQAEEIDALTPPAGDEKKIEAIVEGLEDGVKELAQEPSTIETAFAKVDKLILAYGLEGCTAP